ncbi:MAG: response regulator transcription factor [Anaerolineae bacterium]|nr:MAG: response regulator transcription factor [Anaerolineae bacterium]
MTTTLAVVDAAEIIRIGIREIVSSSDKVKLVGEFTRLEDVDGFLQTTPVNVLVLGNTHTYPKLVQDLSRLRQQTPELKILLLANSFSAEQVEELSNLGALGFVCKDEQLADTLLFAIRPVARGELFISPRVASVLIKTNQEDEATPLNPRQMKVIHYMAQYMTPQEIAMQMQTSASSIYSLQHRIRQVLGVKTTGQILIQAMKRGWIGQEG